MKTHPSLTEEPQAPAIASTLFKRGRDTVLTPAPPANTNSDATEATGAEPALSPEQRLLMPFIDGRQSIARLARLAGLAEDVAARALRALCDRGLLVHVEPAEVTIHARGGDPLYKLGPYEIAARVGQGGMGSVYVCRRIGAAGFRRLFALKVVRQGVGQDDVASRAFVREMSVGRMLTHPNVQSVVDVGMYSDQPYLVLDYVEGTDLEELLAGGARLPPGVLVTVILDVLRGLQAAHDVIDERGRRVGLAHGDVSPPNILIGVDGVARLADFGNARFTELGEIAPNTGPVGKPAFMAPELLRSEPSGQRADLFAVGVVMWTALTGTDLFAAASHDETVRNVLGKEIVPPSAHGAPPCLDDVVMRALSRQPQWRYATPDELAEDLLRVAVDNGLRIPSALVAAHVRSQLGDRLADRRQRIEDGFCGRRLDASLAATLPAVPVAESAPIPEAAPIPTVGRPKIARTVVLPQARAAAAAPPPFRLRPPMLVAIAISLGIAAFAVTAAALSGHLPGDRPQPPLSAARRPPLAGGP
jgi:serine/threonine protein kinase